MNKQCVLNKQLDMWYLCDDLYVVDIFEYFPKPKTPRSVVVLDKEHATSLIEIRMSNKYQGVVMDCDDYRDINGYGIRFIDDINSKFVDKCVDTDASLHLSRNGLYLNIHGEVFMVEDRNPSQMRLHSVIDDMSTVNIIENIGNRKDWDKPLDVALVDRIWMAYDSAGYTFSHDGHIIMFTHHECDGLYMLHFSVGIYEKDTLYSIGHSKAEFILNMARELELFFEESISKSDDGCDDNA